MNLPGNLTFATGSSFGMENTTLAPASAFIIDSDRYRELDRKQAYFDCTQHDWKRYDFDGRVIKPGPPTMQPLLSSEAAPYYVPLKYRRPSNPYRLGRVIISAFTNLLFGEGRFPHIKVDGDEATQDFAQELSRFQRLPVRLIQARNWGGACGSVALSWCFDNGKPRTTVHNVKHMIVHEWADREELIPAYVTEIYRYFEDVWDHQKRGIVRKWLWYRKDWTTQADIVYLPVEVGTGEPQWVIDDQQSVLHNDGICHVVWIQNIPTDSPEGESDLEGVYESLDAIDELYSILSRGTIRNIDPTLVLKIDKDKYKFQSIKKGSDNALTLEVGETAEYLELPGASVATGLSLFESKRKSILEVCQCILLDPAATVANGLSSVAMKMIYASMCCKGDILREQYGDGLSRLLTDQVRVARRYYQMTPRRVLSLPPRQEVKPILDVDGEPTQETQTVPVERQPGNGGTVSLDWPPYFKPTPDDQQKIVATVSQANGGKPVISPETGTDIVSSAFGLNPEVEKKRVAAAKEADTAEQQKIMGGFSGGIGGEVSSLTEPPL